MDGDVNNVLNWSGDAKPGNNDDVIIPAWATNGMTLNLAGLTGVTLNSFWVQDGFAKMIGNDTAGTPIAWQYLELDISGSAPTRFRWEGTSALAKIHFIKTGQNVSIEVIKTGRGNAGKPALQLMSNNVDGLSTFIGSTMIYKGQVALGWDHQVFECDDITIGEYGSKTDAKVLIGKNATKMGGTGIDIHMNGGMVTNDAACVTVDMMDGELEHRNGDITTLNLFGGIFDPNNPRIAASGSANVIATMNLRGGWFRNVRSPTEVEITTANLYKGRFDDPMGAVKWDSGHNVIWKGMWADVETDFGPDKTIQFQ